MDSNSRIRVGDQIAKSLRHFFELANSEERGTSNVDHKQQDIADKIGEALASVFYSASTPLKNALYHGAKMLEQIKKTEAVLFGKNGDTAAKLWLDLIKALQEVEQCLKAIENSYPETIGSQSLYPLAG